MVHRVVWQVGSPAAIDFWAGRLEELGVAFERADGALVLADYEGLAHELVVASVNEPLVAKHPDIPAEHALQGFLGVRAYSFDPAESARLLREVMGAEETSPGNFELTRGKRRGFIAFDPAPDAPGIQSGGSIHHVAWGTTAAEHPRWVEWLRESGVRSTPVIDRHYFHSIYYREPGGVLYEIADDAPGFAVDLPEAEFGTKIILPPWLEERRAEVEARLTPLPDPRADWAVR
jgi:glyoxalase family protein